MLIEDFVAYDFGRLLIHDISLSYEKLADIGDMLQHGSSNAYQPLSLFILDKENFTAVYDRTSTS